MSYTATVREIAGSGFKGATAVYFGATAVTTFTVNASGTKIVVVAPPGAAGTVDITVATPQGTTAVVNGDRYTYA